MPTNKELREALGKLLSSIEEYLDAELLNPAEGKHIDAYEILGNARETAKSLLSRPEGEPSGEGDFIDILFDGPPGPESGRFVEVENHLGKSISLGKWLQRTDEYWALRIYREGQRQAMTEVEALAEARKRWGKSAVIEMNVGDDWKLKYQVREFGSWNIRGLHGEGDSWEAAFAQVDKEGK